MGNTPSKSKKYRLGIILSKRSLNMSRHKLPFYIIGGLFIPLLIGSLTALSRFSDLMIPQAPPALTFDAFRELPPPSLNSSLPTVHILISNQTTQLTDFLAPYEILKRSGRFNVYLVAPKKQLSGTTGSVGVIPHYSFKDAPPAEYLFIPAITDFNNPQITQWVKKQSEPGGVKQIISICEGIRVLLEAGLVQQGPITSHFIAESDISSKNPNLDFKTDVRVLKNSDGIVRIFSAGITGSIDGTLAFLRETQGESLARQAQKKLALDDLFLNNPPRILPEFLDYISLFVFAGFYWNPLSIGVHIKPDVSEIGLAAVLDSLPRAMVINMVSFGEKRAPILTQNGVTLVPTLGRADLPKLDTVFVPPGSPKSKTNPPVENGYIEDWSHLFPGETFAKAYQFLSDRVHPQMSKMSRIMMEYPHSSDDRFQTDPAPSFPWSLLLRPLLLGLLGIGLAYWLLNRKRIFRNPKE